MCDEAAQMKMKTEFRDCATKLSDEFEDTKYKFPKEEYVQVHSFYFIRTSKIQLRLQVFLGFWHLSIFLCS